MSRQGVALGTALVLLAGTGALANLPPARGPAFVPGALATMPADLGPWAQADATEVPPGALDADAAAAVRLRRAYRRGSRTVWVAVDHYPDQREDHRPQSLGRLYPSGGWSDLRATKARVALDGPPGTGLPVTRLVMRRGTERLAVAYWYQVGARASASGHWYRVLVLFNRLVHRRPDSALVRVASPLPDGSEAEVTRAQGHFIRVFYPELARRLSERPATGREGA